MLSSMVYVRWTLKRRGPDRVSCLLPSPIFSTEGISLPLCREKTVGPQGFPAAPSHPALNQVAVAVGKVGILRAAALEGSSSCADRPVTLLEAKIKSSLKTFT